MGERALAGVNLNTELRYLMGTAIAPPRRACQPPPPSPLPGRALCSAEWRYVE